jgi:response regulator RpfG family c-di-GMP phosphodiesterase
MTDYGPFPYKRSNATPPIPSIKSPGHCTLLLVSSEAENLALLNHDLRDEGYQILTATSILDALDILKQKNIALILCDEQIGNTTGKFFLQQSSQIQPNLVRILLTSNAESTFIINAINRGEIHHIILKPWEEDELIRTVRLSLQHYNLTIQNQALKIQLEEKSQQLDSFDNSFKEKYIQLTEELQKQKDLIKDLHNRLDKNLNEMVDLFMSLLQLINAYEAGHSKRVSILAQGIVSRYNLSAEQTFAIEIAAKLHDIGKIGISGVDFTKPDRFWTDTERLAVRRHPVIGQALTIGIEALKPVGILIRHQHEQFDGNGYPDKLAGANIPLGARIIAVANRYDRLTMTYDGKPKGSVEFASQELVCDKGVRYDPEVVKQLLIYLNIQAKNKPVQREIKIPVNDLRIGMMLSRDLYDGRGMLLMNANTVLTPSHIERLMHFHEVEPFEPINIFSS